ncbi:MAG: stage II sporulation protein M [Cyanobacteria bacterium P01_A01_bin.37]
MHVQRWIARRESSWNRLDELLKRVDRRGIHSLNADEVKDLSSLYRSVSSDLARARTQQLGDVLVQDLQTLTSRAYNQVYQGSRRQEWTSVIDFVLWGFPAVVQQTRIYTAIATVIFLAGVFIAWWFSWQDPSFISLVVPESLIQIVRDDGELWMGSIVGIEPQASSNIMVNNISVSFRAIFGGVTYLIKLFPPIMTPPGIFTTYILFLNGVIIGAIATLVGQHNLAYPFWAFVFPHGSLELPAIFMAGGAGLLLARSILFPGAYRRADALIVYGRQAAQLVFGIVPMLFIAGIIEGFFSPNPSIPDPIKYLVGTGLFIGLVYYCRRKRSAE